jgi:hypothetical protein
MKGGLSRASLTKRASERVPLTSVEASKCDEIIALVVKARKINIDDENNAERAVHALEMTTFTTDVSLFATTTTAAAVAAGNQNSFKSKSSSQHECNGYGLMKAVSKRASRQASNLCVCVCDSVHLPCAFELPVCVRDSLV